jgi:predicted anti-sigma-YlaC factor YlaD
MTVNPDSPVIPADTVDAATRRRRLRSRNLAVVAVLLSFVLLVYLVAIVRMSGGSLP